MSFLLPVEPNLERSCNSYQAWGWDQTPAEPDWQGSPSSGAPRRSSQVSSSGYHPPPQCRECSPQPWPLCLPTQPAGCHGDEPMRASLSLMPESFQALPCLAPNAALGGDPIERKGTGTSKGRGGAGVMADLDSALRATSCRKVPGSRTRRGLQCRQTFIAGGGWWGEAGAPPLSL